MPGCTALRLGAPGSAAMAYTRRAGEGCAGRFATDRGVARCSLTLALANRSGLRVPATPSSDQAAGRTRGSGVRTGEPSERVGEQAACREPGQQQGHQEQDGEEGVRRGWEPARAP